jgi:hypothetical protein
MKMYRIGRIRGVVYQNHWMSMHRIPPLPLWLVGWFVIPFEDFKLWRRKKHERMIEERRRQDDGDRLQSGSFILAAFAERTPVSASVSACSKASLAHGTAENVCHSDRATSTVASKHRKARPQRGD